MNLIPGLMVIFGIVVPLAAVFIAVFLFFAALFSKPEDNSGERRDESNDWI